MFQYYQNQMCVEGGWLYEEGDILNKDLYDKYKQRGKIVTLRRGGNGRTALVLFESIPTKYREIIISKFGDPYKVLKQNSFLNSLHFDAKAFEFYSNYVTNTGSPLPQKNINEYVANATILNGVQILVNKALGKRGALGGSSKIWNRVSSQVQDLPIDLYPHSLPSNERRLKLKYKTYLKQGYESLVHKGFGNENSEKINKDAQLWVLARWGNRVAKVANLAQLLFEYNEKSKSKGWKPLKDEKTLHNFLYKESIKHLWYGARYGDLKAKEKYTIQHSTKLPTMRDSLWYSDGTKLNYFYQYINEKGETKVGTCNVYEVMDAYSEVLLGYHISDTEDYQAQYHAYKMAIQISGHKPYQLGFDGQGGHKKLKAGNFLDKLSRMAIKTAPYNGRSKTIESAFGRFQKQFMKKDWFFCGQNITATKLESKADREMILTNKKDLPTLAQVKSIYLKRRKEWNEAPHPASGTPRVQMYEESYNPETPKIGMWDMVDLFWIKRDKPSTYAGYGISFKEKKVKYDYMVYDENQLPDVKFLRENIDKKFHIKFDPEDMSLIYLYEMTPLGLRFVTEARTKITIHRGKQEQDELDDAYIAKIKIINENSRKEVAEEMDKILEKHGATPEQQGLRSPGLLGIKSTRKKAANNVGKLTKEESNLVVSLENDNDKGKYYDKY